MYIQHRHRVYGILRIFHVPVLYQLTNCNAYSTLWHHVFLCVDHKIEMTKIGLHYKTFSHLCAQHQHNSEHDIPFMYNFFNLPFFVFDLINNSMFAWRIRKVFLKIYGQTNIGCTGSSVHNHMCVITFCTLQLHSWY